MNTPAHVVANGLLLGRGRWRPHWLAISVGALLPDVPMVVFYVYERLVLGASEATIWSRAYFAPGWQAVFDVSHSIPLTVAGALAAWKARAPALAALLASMGLHALADLLLHGEDAHAHFLPLSGWRYRSAVSYWDPHRYGLVFAAAEALLVLAGSLVLMRRPEPTGWRLVGWITLGVYVLFAIFVVLVWAS